MHTTLIGMGFKLYGSEDELNAKFLPEGNKEPVDLDYIEEETGTVITMTVEPISTKWGLRAEALTEAQTLAYVTVDPARVNTIDAIIKSSVFAGPIEATSIEPTVYHKEDLVLSVYGIHVVPNADADVLRLAKRSFFSENDQYNYIRWLEENKPALLVNWYGKYLDYKRGSHIYDLLVKKGAEVTEPLRYDFERAKAMGGMYNVSTKLTYEDIAFKFSTNVHIYEEEVNGDLILHYVRQSCNLSGIGITVITEDGYFDSSDILVQLKDKIFMAPQKIKTMSEDVHKLISSINLYGSSYVNESQMLDAGFKVVV